MMTMMNSPSPLSLISHPHITLPPQLVDLPTVVECHKTLDNKTLYKAGDISQMLVCSQEPPDTAAVTNITELPTAQQKEYLKKFTYNHGGETCCTCSTLANSVTY